ELVHEGPVAVADAEMRRAPRREGRHVDAAAELDGRAAPLVEHLRKGAVADEAVDVAIHRRALAVVLAGPPGEVDLERCRRGYRLSRERDEDSRGDQEPSEITPCHGCSSGAGLFKERSRQDPALFRAWRGWGAASEAAPRGAPARPGG